MGRPCTRCGEQIEFVRTSSSGWHPVEDLDCDEYRVWTEPPSLQPGQTRYPRRFVLESGDVLSAWIVVENTGKSPRFLDGPCRVFGRESHLDRCQRPGDVE